MPEALAVQDGGKDYSPVSPVIQVAFVSADSHLWDAHFLKIQDITFHLLKEELPQVLPILTFFSAQCWNSWNEYLI